MYLLLSVVTILFGIPSFGAARFILDTPPSKQIHLLNPGEKETIEAVSEYIDGYVAHYNRLPTYSEFSQWTSANEKKYPRLDGYGMWLIDEHFEADLVKVFGVPSEHGYVLEFWTGSSIASYASWNKSDSAYITEREYYAFGSKMKAVFIFMIVPILILCCWTFLIIQTALSFNRIHA